MYVAYRAGETLPLPKKKTRKQEVEELGRRLMAKWRAQDRAAALKKYKVYLDNPDLYEPGSNFPSEK